MTIHSPFTGSRACRGGALVKFILFVAIVFAVLALAWMLFLPSILKSVLEKRTGFEIQIAKMSANPFTGNLSLVGLAINNPSGWPAREFVNVREFTAEADVWSFFSSRPIVNNAIVDVAFVSVVTDSQGKTNVRLFQDRVAGPNDPAQRKPPQPELKPEFLIRQLRLRFDKVTMADYSGGKKTPTTREVNLNLDKTYKDVTDAKQLLTGALPGIEAIGSAISALVPGKLGKAIGGAMNDPAELLKNTGKKAGGAIKGLLEKLEEKPKP